jgi:hypothetical protein
MNRKRGPPRKAHVRVDFFWPDGADEEAILEYVRDAVASWSGGLRPAGSYDDQDPGDPMYEMDRDSVEVKMLRLAK